jgi:hypothetical protein
MDLNPLNNRTVCAYQAKLSVLCSSKHSCISHFLYNTATNYATLPSTSHPCF